MIIKKFLEEISDFKNFLIIETGLLYLIIGQINRGRLE